MDIIVCMKQIVDLRQIRIKKESREAVIEGAPLVFSDIDMNALEEAVKIKEKDGGKVIALAIGSPKLKETVKDALARGADEAAIVLDPSFDNMDSRIKSEILVKAIQKIGRFDLVFLGEGSADNYSGQVGPRLAELLDLPLCSYASEVVISNGKATVTRSMEDSFEVVEAALPVLITVTSEINKARIPSLTQILKAGKKPIQEWKPANLGVAAGQGDNKLISNLAPVEERKMIILEEGKLEDNVKTVVDSLIKEGVLGR